MNSNVCIRMSVIYILPNDIYFNGSNKDTVAIAVVAISTVIDMLVLRQQ